MLFQGFTGDGRVMAFGAASAPRQEKGSGHRQQSMPLLHKQSEPGGVFCKQIQALSLSPHTHTGLRNHITVNVVLLIITVSLLMNIADT